MERKFDKRIDKDLIDVYTIFNRFSSDLIGTTVYASNVLKNFQNLENCKKGIVDHIDNHGFAVTLENGETFFFYFVIPAFSVKVEEKVFRPYTLREFLFEFPIGQPIKFRKKGEKKDEWLSVLTGYWNHQIGDEVVTYIFIGPVQYTLDELFNDYEWQTSNTKDFKPFGVEK